MLSNWMETPVGNYSSWALFAIIPAVAVYFDVIDRIETGIKMAAWGHVFLETGMGTVFLVCGVSLKRVVDDSLRRNSARIAASAEAAGTADDGNKDKLVAVRKKATRMTWLIVQQVCGKYATHRFPSPYPNQT